MPPPITVLVCWGITFGVLAIWYGGAGFTLFSGFAVSIGMIVMYVIHYVIINLLIMYLVADRRFIWPKKTSYAPNLYDWDCLIRVTF